MQSKQVQKIRKKPQVKRLPWQLFDGIFKRLMYLSSSTIVQFINALFDTNYPITSIVQYPNTEILNRKRQKRIADILIRIVALDGEHNYLIEAQTKDDPGLVVRIFEYSLGAALQRRIERGVGGREGNRLVFPESKIIYFKIDGPAEEELVCTFGKQGEFIYKVPALYLLKYSIAELEAMKLTILLPFYVLKLRHEVENAKTSEMRQALAKQMEGILHELEGAIERGTAAGVMSSADMETVIDHTKELLFDLYSEYEEFTEVTTMVKGTLLSFSERAVKKERLRSEKMLQEAEQALKEEQLKAKQALKKAERKAGQTLKEEQLKAKQALKEAELKTAQALKEEQLKAKQALKKAQLKAKQALKEAELKAEKDRRVMVQNLKKTGWDIERIAQTMELDIEYIKSLYDNPE